MTSLSPIEAALAGVTFPELDVEALRRDFPTLEQEVHPGKPLVYLDSAATALKPQCVIDAVVSIYAKDCANVHRAVHAMSQRATARMEATRDTVKALLNAAEREEIIFTAGTTESINLVAQTWGRANLSDGDEILLTELEHHSNIVPWQLIAEQTGSRIVHVPIDDDGSVPLESFAARLGPRTKIAAFAHVSNSLGTVLPVRAMTKLAHDVGARVLIDGAQAVVHSVIDVREIDADFYAFSGHKLYGPTGVGVLYGKRDVLEAMPPWHGGGDMIDRVTFAGSTYNDLPYRLEAGTPNIAGIVGLGAAIEYLTKLNRTAVFEHERALLSYGTVRLQEIEGLRLIGTARHKSGVLAFVLDGIHPTDAGTLLDASGIAIRTGHHCAQPVMDHFAVSATARASLALYNTTADIDALVDGLEHVRSFF